MDDITKLSRRGFMSGILLSGFIGMGSSSALSDVAQDSWPMCRYNPQNTGYNPNVESSFQNRRLKEIISKETPIYSSPAITNDRIYVANSDEELYAINRQTGDIEWTYSITVEDNSRRKNVSSPAVADGRIYVGSTDGRLYCISESGDKSWHQGTGESIESSPIIDGGSIYVGSNTGKVYSFDAKNGSKNWAFTTSGEVVSSPAVGKTAIYVGANTSPYEGKNLYRINKKTHKTEWEQLTEGSIAVSPVLFQNTLYVGDTNGILYAIDPKTGTIKWEFGPEETDGEIDSTLSVNEKGIFFISGQTLYAVPHSGNSSTWTYPIGWNSTLGLSITSQSIYVGKDDSLFAIGVDDGTEMWRESTSASVEGIPSITNNEVVFGNNDGVLYSVIDENSEEGLENKAGANSADGNSSNSTETSSNKSTDVNNQKTEGNTSEQTAGNSGSDLKMLGIASILALILGIITKILDIPLKIREYYRMIKRE